MQRVRDAHELGQRGQQRQGEGGGGRGVLRQGRQTVVRRADLGSGDLDHADGDGQIKAPMHGKVLALLVSNGEQVEKGQRLVIVER